MGLSALGPRILLRRLREVMAEQGSTQSKLDSVVRAIAANMVAEVCSLYVKRPGDVLELYATEGLKSESVHHAKLRVGEGLVGTIAELAEPLNLADAQHNPAFKYLPETGEEIYNSFLGVPLMRGGEVIGVLVVQNRTRRSYSEEEEEALLTIATVLAEVIAAGGLKEVATDTASDVAHIRTHVLTGETLVDGVALGFAVLHEPRVQIVNVIAENIPEEKQRLARAIDLLRLHVDELVSGSDARNSEYSEVLEAFRMFAHDRGWITRLQDAIETGLTAEAAVDRVQNENRARMNRTQDEYLRERMHDLDDLANRLLRLLSGQVATAARGDLPDNAIVVARNMGPAELLDYDRTKVRAVILEDAGRTSHVAIVARALGIPVLGQVKGASDLVDNGNPLIVDGGTGELHIRPPDYIERAYVEKVRFYARKQARFADLRDKPAITRDGVTIRLKVNAGLVIDLPHLHDSGADGIGLYRTELQFMIAQRFPRYESQVRLYRTILDMARGKPVVFRTLDIGADKTLPYLRLPKEENPAMGWRAIRLALDRPALLRLQVRAMLEASGEDTLHILFPMIAVVDEFVTAKDIVLREKAYLQKRNRPVPEKIRFGAMIEVPALLWQLDQLLPLVDFASIGSNDLTQFLYAADRSNVRLSNRYDALSPALLSAFRHIARSGVKYNVPITLCGELGGSTLEAMAMIGIGITSFSMVPAAVGPVKAMLMQLDRAKLMACMEPLLSTAQHSIRTDLLAFASDNGIPL